jgi:ABC-type arginine transport system permease subunit
MTGTQNLYDAVKWKIQAFLLGVKTRCPSHIPHFYTLIITDLTNLVLLLYLNYGYKNTLQDLSFK